MTDPINLDSKKKVKQLNKINVVVESINMKTEKDQEDISSKLNSKVETKEYGGRAGLEPTRFGDWEKNGRCIDF